MIDLCPPPFLRSRGVVWSVKDVKSSLICCSREEKPHNLSKLLKFAPQRSEKK